MKKIIALSALVFTMISCDILQEMTQTQKILPPSETEVIAGLKEALEVGIKNSVSNTSKEGGFLNNSLISIPFPPEAARMESVLRDMGMGRQVDNFVATLNRSAEVASKQAVEVFAQSIRQMTFSDAMSIWRGEPDAATQFFKRTTTEELTRRFQPSIRSAINEVELTSVWNPLASTYNSIPFVTKVNPNLEEYVTSLAIDGLFTMVAQEEAKIRENPAARVTDILKSVFGYQEPTTQT